MSTKKRAAESSEEDNSNDDWVGPKPTENNNEQDSDSGFDINPNLKEANDSSQEAAESSTETQPKKRKSNFLQDKILVQASQCWN